ncbi:MAG: hypothetical protein ACLFV7_00820 [Phycisphaerae bacterium]
MRDLIDPMIRAHGASLLILSAFLIGGCPSPPDDPSQESGVVNIDQHPRVRRLEDAVHRLRAEAQVREMKLQQLRRRESVLANQVRTLQIENRRQLEHIKSLGSIVAEREKLRKQVSQLQQEILRLRELLEKTRELISP